MARPKRNSRPHTPQLRSYPGKRGQVSQSFGRTAALYFGAAALIGGLGGLASVVLSAPDPAATLLRGWESFKAVTETRPRPPQAGDTWSGCNAARAAGTAPIYVGEPGYRAGLDGDGDGAGIACEPYH